MFFRSLQLALSQAIRPSDVDSVKNALSST
jgi:hypothetical protein